MKIDKSLEEVWRWKEAVYNKTKNMNMDEMVKYIHERAEAINKKYNLHLRTVDHARQIAKG